MASKVAYFQVNVTDVDRSINFYRRVLGVREVRTWNDAHTEKAVLFDLGTVKLVLSQPKKDWPDPHTPKKAVGKTWMGVQQADVGAIHQTLQVGSAPDAISPMHDAITGKGRCFYVTDPDGNPIVVGDQSPFEGSGGTGIRPRVQ